MSKIASGSMDSPKRRVQINSPLTVSELARKLRMYRTEIIKALFMKNIMRTTDQIVEVETARQLAVELGFELIDEQE